jgi:glycogen phosphorylase
MADSARDSLDVAYFSMEIMLESDIPTYAGGLGVLAGDLLRSCADLKIPAVGVSLVYSGASSRQIINPDGSQSFKETEWQKSDQLTKLPNRISLKIMGEEVFVDCWRYDFVGQSNFNVPVYLLDTDLPENPQWAKDLTKNLYGGGGETRIGQEILLSIGGVKMLRDLGYSDVKVYHMNEGHCAFVPLALLPEHGYKDEEVKKICAFTTHTPVPEGHDKFSYDFAYKFAEPYLPWHIKKIATEENLSMTHLAMNMSSKTFAVSRKHQKVSENLFPGYKIDYITNGVHHLVWTNPIIQDLFNTFLPGWVGDPKELEKALEKLPDDKLWEAHQACKSKLIETVNHHLTSLSPNQDEPTSKEFFDNETLTIALARRPVPYKRPLLLYSDLERLVRIGAGKIQIIQCGKSHPNDDTSQGFVKQIVEMSKKLGGILKIVYLENYSPMIARILVSGCDVWLNTPRRPLEASGTSGMKAALNGVLNLSVLDGWWIEGKERVPKSGFAIGPLEDSLTPSNNDQEDADDLYKKLEDEIIPLYYGNHSEWLQRMKYAITLGAYFNTHRAIREYQEKAWEKVSG